MYMIYRLMIILYTQNVSKRMCRYNKTEIRGANWLSTKNETNKPAEQTQLQRCNAEDKLHVAKVVSVKASILRSRKQKAICVTFHCILDCI